jgi:hypothetical protein
MDSTLPQDQVLNELLDDEVWLLQLWDEFTKLREDVFDFGLGKEDTDAD